MKKQRRGLFLALFGLIAGLLVGIAITTAQKYGAEALVELLRDEVKISTGCDLAFESINISILTQSAKARNAAIICAGKPALGFKKLTAQFSLSRLIEHIIILENLTLSDGYASGISPRSATFRFVDHLVKPLPPEKRRPDRWRVRLERIDVFNTGFEEKLSRATIKSERLQLTARRNREDDFEITSQADHLRTLFFAKDKITQTSEIKLGTLGTFLLVKDDEVLIKNLRLSLDNSWMQFSGLSETANNDKLSGTYNFFCDKEAKYLNQYVATDLSGSGQAEGFIDNPITHGKIQPALHQPFDLLLPVMGNVKFDSLSAGSTFNFGHGDPWIELSDVVVESKDNQLTTSSPIYLDDDKLSAAFTLKMKQFKRDYFEFNNLKIDAVLSGNFDEPRLELDGLATDGILLNLLLPALDFKASVEGNRANYWAKHDSETFGSMRLDGALTFSDNEAPILEDNRLEVRNYNFESLFNKVLGGKLSALKLNGSGLMRGEWDLKRIEASSKFTVSVPAKDKIALISGESKLSQGLISAGAADRGEHIKASLNIGLATDGKGQLKIDMKDNTSELLAAFDCFNSVAKLDYNFDLAQPKAGSGALNLQALELGCGRYRMATARPIQLPVSTGSMNLGNLQLLGSDSTLSVKGQASLDKLDVNADGTVQMRTFLPLFPSLDNLRGQVKTSLRLEGNAFQPQLKGNAILNGGQVDIESANLSAQNIEGEIILDDGAMRVGKLFGDVNGGSFKAEGSFYPLNLAASDFKLHFEDIYLSSIEDLNLAFDGDMQFVRLDSGSPGIKGNIEIESGEFQRNIDFTSIIKAMPDFILRRNAQANPSSSLPAFDIDINIRAPRNLFVLTSILNAELQANLNVSGKLNNPVVRGDMEVISGWLGFKDRQFEISAGKVIFRSGQREPNLELISEASVLSRTGDNVQVVLEANGPLSNPRVSLSSDRGYTERELFALITSGSNLSGQTRVNSLQSGFDFSAGRIEEDQSIFNPSVLVDYLTQIDSLGVEPSFNFLTGSMEPALVARKRLLDQLTLAGESFFGASENLARAQLIYNLTPSVNLAGLAESRSTRNETSLEANLTYTILSNQSKFLELTFSGNENTAELAIRKALRLNENSRVGCDQVERLSKSLLKFYQSRGYFSASVKLQPSCDTRYMRSLHFEINEGIRSYIQGVDMSGDSVEEIFDVQDLTQDNLAAPATEKALKSSQSNIVKRLRSEGYIASRVQASYLEMAGSDDKTLRINIFLGKPVSFTFVGNKHFTPEEFLQTINLFERKLPLGNNTINILVEGIERKYREAGFLYATITYKREEDSANGRVNYTISINEEEMVLVSNVVFEGNTRLTNGRIKELLAESDPKNIPEIFAPRVAEAEKLEGNIALIKQVYQQEGFPYATVAYKIVPSPDEQSVEIHYEIEEGLELTAAWLKIEGLPAGVEAPQPPQGVYSVSVANSLIDQALNTLHDRGYLTPSFSSRFDDKEKKLIVAMQPGSQTVISQIEVEGNVKVDSKIIFSTLTILPGDAWDSQKILENKRKLLRLGLYSRVDIIPRDGTLDEQSEVLLVRVYERPLQSLEVGGGANSVLGAHIFTIATDRGLFEDGRSLALISDIYYDPRSAEISQGIAGLTYTHPNLLGSDYTLTEDLRYQKLETTAQEFDLDRVLLTSNLYRTLSESTSYTFGYTIQQEDLSDVPPDAVISDLDTGLVRLGFLSGYLLYDKRDAPLNARKGYQINFDYKLSADAVGSQANFYSLGTRAIWLHPLDQSAPRFSLAAGMRMASAWTFGSTEEVPISQRFYTGGRASVRGFRENSLGPRGDQGSVIGGDTLFVNNFELRYMLTDNTSVHTFMDAGTVYLKDRGISIDDMRYSTGLGARYISPVGPIGVDIGHPLDEEPGEPSWRMHFSIGSNF